MSVQVSTVQSPRRSRWTRRAIGEALEGYAFIMPWIIGFLVLTLGPMLASLYFSFTHYSIIRPPRFTGLENYIRAFSGKDRLFYGSLLRTARFALYYVPLGVAISLLLAVMLDRKLIGTTIYRTLFFLPTLTPAAASSLLWSWLLNPEVGPINYLLYRLGIEAPRWLASPEWALPTIVMIAIWGTVGGSRMIIFLAGLQGVPEELYDAASIDGANSWQRFRHVTLPMISPVVFFNLVLSAIAAFRVFTFAFMTTGGGPAYATWFYMLHLYNTAFRSLFMGYASALAWVLFIIVFIFTVIQFRLSGRWVFYSGETQAREA
ncbi:MAG: sugar ABC transporter permease [Chloroflexi bacterium]|nr:sugar ABC transporter permease [Chloroflexota bacterium]